jgi:hypothetical protein
MKKVVKGPIKLRKGAVKTERSRNPQTGEMIVLRQVDSGSTTFAGDLSDAFRSNVRSALRNSKK